MKLLRLIFVAVVLFVAVSCGKKGALIPPDQLSPAKVEQPR